MAPKGSKRAASKPSPAPAKKGRAAKKDPDVEKCQAVVRALEAIQPSVMPKAVSSMLAKMQEHCLLIPKADRHEYQVSVVDMTGEALASLEASMDQGVQQEQAKVNGAAADKTVRDEALASKTLELEKLENAVQEREAAVSQDTKALEAANKAERDAKTAQKTGDKSFAEAQGEIERITDALNGALVPMRDRVPDIDEKPLLKNLVAVGKSYNFDSSMMTALPVALKKDIAARSEFDKMVVTQIETSMREKIGEYQKLVDAGSDGVAARAGAVDEAVAKAAAASEQKIASVAALKEAKAAKAAGVKAQQVAKQSVSNYLVDLKATSDSLDERQAALSEFRAGAKAYFAELRELAAPSAEPAAPVSPALEKSPAKSPAPASASLAE